MTDRREDLTDPSPGAAPAGAGPQRAGAGTGAPGDPATDPAETSGTGRRRRILGRWWWLGGLAIAVVVVVVLAPLASPDPDGLESVAGQQGWLQTALGPVYDLIPDYRIPGLDGHLSTIVAGLIGVAIVFLLVLGLGWLLRRRRAA
jgi:ABC-type Fe3+-siderophore transport system permease subunit